MSVKVSGCCLIFVNVSIASKVTEIGRNSVVMYVSDQFIDGKLQLTHYRDPSTKKLSWGFGCGGGCQMHCNAQCHLLTTASEPYRLPACHSVILSATLGLNISETRPDSGMVPMDSL